MDWAAAIELNRNALLRVLSGLFATAGLTPGGQAAASLPNTGLPETGFSTTSLSRHVRYAVLRILRPAESAARRLIVIAARIMARESVSVTIPPVRPAPASPIPRGEDNDGQVPAFSLFDRRKRFEFVPRRRGPNPVPRIWIPGITERFVIEEKKPPTLDDPVDARRLCLRLQSLQRALEDLPGQARRLVRMKAKREKPGRDGSRWQGYLHPMRPGRPPGYRAKSVHEVDAILRECQALALDAFDPPDTS